MNFGTHCNGKQSNWPVHVQCSLFITLCLGSIRMDQVIRKSCYKGTILQRNYFKMTIGHFKIVAL